MNTRLQAVAFTLVCSAIAPVARAQPPQHLASWGSYGTLNGQLNGPTDIALSPEGIVYIADLGNQRVDLFTTEGVYLTKLRDSQPPGKLAVAPNGNIYVAYSSRITLFNSRGDYLLDWPGQFTCLAIGPSGNVYALEHANERVKVFTADGTFVTMWGAPGGGPGQFHQPLDLTVGPDGTVYVADTYNHRVQTFTADGQFIRAWGTPGSGPGEFNYPEAVAVDGQGLVYVADYNKHIQVFDSSGSFVTQFGSGGIGPGQFDVTVAMAFDASGTLYVLDHGNNRVDKFGVMPTPTRIVTWGQVKARYR